MHSLNKIHHFLNQRKLTIHWMQILQYVVIFLRYLSYNTCLEKPNKNMLKFAMIYQSKHCSFSLLLFFFFSLKYCHFIINISFPYWCDENTTKIPPQKERKITNCVHLCQFGEGDKYSSAFSLPSFVSF